MASVAERLKAAAAAAKLEATFAEASNGTKSSIHAAERLKVAAEASKLNAIADKASNDTRLGAIALNSSSSKLNTERLPSSQPYSLLSTVAALKGQSSTDRKNVKAGANKFRSAALALKITGSTTPWGEFDHLVGVDISTLSNEKLKRHLKARNEIPEGTKLELIERLKNSIEEERQRKIAIELELETKHRKIADLEEKGAIYVVGKNDMGQLGLGDLEDRHEFTVIPCTRGKYFQHVSAGGNIVLATTDKHEVYAWGAKMGPTGINANRKQLQTPQLIEKLNGEEAIMTSAGANHACAASKGGDLFVWGFGVLGLGDEKRSSQTPVYVDTITVSSVECGEMHTCVKTNDDDAYSWGHGANGRLGHDNPSSVPSPVKLPTSEKVRLIACGSEHTLICTQSSLYAFGCGDGGRLGLGDHSDRFEPCEVTSMRGSHFLSISAGTWHSACVVHVAPLDDSGWLFTWGSGFQGQLGQGKTCKISTPTIVQDFIDEGLSIKRIVCGSHHNAAICNDGNLYTWGSNQNGALGRSIGQPFTPHPGVVAEFGTLVKRIGRGLPMSVACGREYTIVATHPYNGPTEEEAMKLEKERQLREEEEYKRQEELRKAKEMELKRLEEVEAEKTKIEYLTSKRLCTMDPSCPGFTYEPNQPSICRECGYSVVFHTKQAKE